VNIEKAIHKMDIKEKIKGNYIVRCIYYLLDDYLNKVRSLRGVVETNSGTIHAEKEVDESIVYIREVFNDYKRYAGIERFYGRVAEVGPGDNCGVAILFIEDGCEKVDLADRFYSVRNALRQENIYKELLKSNHVRLQMQNYQTASFRMKKHSRAYLAIMVIVHRQNSIFVKRTPMIS